LSNTDCNRDSPALVGSSWQNRPHDGHRRRHDWRDAARRHGEPGELGHQDLRLQRRLSRWRDARDQVRQLVPPLGLGDLIRKLMKDLEPMPEAKGP
jgi:hypothetical protein